MMLSDWEQDCAVQHGDKCHKLIPFAKRYVPDWVIDTDQGCIVPGKQVDEYVALSYVWSSPVESSDGMAADRLLLQRDNLEDLQNPGYLFSEKIRNRLPVVIQDSMKLVFHSGTRYLWVDCLCIIQNDERTRDRVAFLPEIYSGALFTIIAATEANGLRGSMAPSQSPAPKLSVGRLHGDLLASRWATRGWTFQEHMLSKRSIVFLDRAIFWDCQCSVWWQKHQGRHGSTPDCEGQVSTASLNEETHETDEDLPQRLASYYSPNLALYRELVCRYNHRDLTYPQDALPAFSGVIDALIPSFDCGSISGPSTPVLDLSLTWQPFSKAKRRIAASSGQHFAPASPLPSWSWIGWQCLVDPKSLRSCLSSSVSSNMPQNLSINAGSRSASFLSKTTTTAELRIRRILVPWSRDKPRQLQGRFSVSIFDTDRYKEPELDDMCPVITLENCEGK